LGFLFIFYNYSNKIPRVEILIISQVDPSVICIFLMVLMFLTLGLGYKIRRRFWSVEEGDTRGGVNSLLAALFGLWGFMLAFTFNQTGNRFENVRSMIVDEANFLRTAIIKADLFPDSVRNVYRSDLQKYLEERIAYYDEANNEVKFKENREAISRTAAALWERTARLSKNSGTSAAATSMVLTLTNLFDIGIKREALLNAGIPTPITFMLIALALAICFVGGFTTPAFKLKERIVIAVFVLLAVTILYITIDLSRPMQGIIKPDTGQAAIVELRNFF
jgi:hypothetical protein